MALSCWKMYESLKQSFLKRVAAKELNDLKVSLDEGEFKSLFEVREVDGVPHIRFMADKVNIGDITWPIHGDFKVEGSRTDRMPHLALFEIDRSYHRVTVMENTGYSVNDVLKYFGYHGDYVDQKHRYGFQPTDPKAELLRLCHGFLKEHRFETIDDLYFTVRKQDWSYKSLLGVLDDMGEAYVTSDPPRMSNYPVVLLKTLVPTGCYVLDGRRRIQAMRGKSGTWPAFVLECRVAPYNTGLMATAGIYEDRGGSGGWFTAP